MPSPQTAGGTAGPQQTDGKAVASLVLGILGLFPLSILAGIPAVVLGHLSLSTIKGSMGRLKGEGMALAGLIMGYISLVAVPVMLIIAAIAIPSLLRTRMATNEAAAASTLRTLNTTVAIYQTNHDAYPASLQEMRAENPGFIDSLLVSAGQKNGYRFTYTRTENPDGYAIHADPISNGSTGIRHFYSDQTNIIRYRRNAPADADSDMIGSGDSSRGATTGERIVKKRPEMILIK